MSGKRAAVTVGRASSNPTLQLISWVVWEAIYKCLSQCLRL